MSTDLLFQYLTWTLFLLVFAAALVDAVRFPLGANVDIALLFGAPSLAIMINLAVAVGLVAPGPLPDAANTSLMLALSHFLLRLVNDFSSVPPVVMRLSEAGLLLLVAGSFWLPPPRPLWYTLLSVTFFVGHQSYATAAFARESRRSAGVTRRRMEAAAGGSVLLGLAFLAAAIDGCMGLGKWWTMGFFEVPYLASAVFYLLGFAPPAWLRHSWQAPELRRFLGRVAVLPRLPSLDAVLRELESGVAASLGVADAGIGLWDEGDRRLRFTDAGKPYEVPLEGTTAGQSFLAQKPAFSPGPPRGDSAQFEWCGAGGVEAVLAAPITIGEKRLGVLTAYVRRAPIFARDDMSLLQLLADQAAVVLESHTLIAESARLRAREQATQMKEDFLSAAAHELKTPLTAILAQSQLLERRARHNPGEPVDLEWVERLVNEARRMAGVVDELLDVSRAERGELVGARERVDLVEVAREVCGRERQERGRCRLEANGEVVGDFDRIRITQLLEELIDNAIKYSPGGGEVVVKVWQQDGEARLDVVDHGIGIPREDLPHVFGRFYRGTNVDDRRFAGMGLGLHVSRGIVEEHHGRIWVSSTPGQGSVFHVALPAGIQLMGD
ncbi:MAG: ATP-binding protein [Sphingomonadaceae bacterium]